MTGPADVVIGVVTKLKAISALVTLVDSASNIVAHDQGFPAKTIQEAVYELTPPGILVIWRGCYSSPARPLAHRISIVIRPKVGKTHGEMIAAILNGTATGANVKFLYDELHSSCTHPENVRAEVASLMIGDNPPAYLDYPELSFDLTEKRS